MCSKNLAKLSFLGILFFVILSASYYKFFYHYENMNNFNFYQFLFPEDNSDPECILPSMPHLKIRNSANKFNLSCEKYPTNIVSIKNAKFRFTPNNNHTHCVYRVIKSLNDDETLLNKESVPFKDGDSIPNDYFKVFCYNSSKNDEPIFQIKMVAVKPLHSVAEERSKTPHKSNSLQYNVAMLGFDAMSRVSFMENLPDVYDLFTKQMNGVVFEKHTVVGDGSTPNLVGMTTGLSVEYLLMMYNKVDDYPLIYKYFQNNGYMTLFFEDTSKYGGVYTKRQTGFKRTPPIDHYSRPFYVDGFVDFGCLGSLPSYKMYMNLLHEMYDVYNKTVKKFPFIFQVQCSHDDNKEVQTVEKDLLEDLKQFRTGGKFDNTILFLFSDHGIRTSSRRTTLSGKYEERLPFLGIYLPDTLQKQRPDLLQTLRQNSKFLTSQFDLYATLMQILGEKTPNSNQSLSLLSPLPLRTCEEAGIESHWCMCNERKNISTTDERVLSAAQEAISAINRYTLKLRHICSELKLNETKFAEQLYLNQGVLNHLKTAKPKELLFIVTFSASPGDGVFESSVRYDIEKQKFDAKISEISRINRYAPWIKCLKNQYVIMRKFCICKDTL